MQKLLLANSFFPTHADNRMEDESDVTKARNNFLESRFRNLNVLLRHRYAWMNSYLKSGDVIVELGSGHGLIREFIKGNNLVLTDIVKHGWIDRKMDATCPDFEEGSVDVFICSHMIHHLASPMAFFDNVYRCLKPEGLLLIQDINTSLIMRLLLYVMRHEGWSYGIDVFDRRQICNDPADPWSANCAIPELLFRDTEAFERQCPGFRVLRSDVNEGFIFPLSGGVISKTEVPELPDTILNAVGLLDRVLIALFPNVFAMGRSVVLQKTTPAEQRGNANWPKEPLSHEQA